MTQPAADLISVIMPCFNAEAFLAEAIGSVMSQTYENVELIVADDGSTDPSRQIVERLAIAHAGRVKLIHTPRLGPYPARNSALREAKGRHVAFLDADDWWVPETLEKLYSALVAHNADISYCGWQNVGEKVKAEPYVPPAFEEADPVEAFVRTCPWPIHAALVKREIVDRLGGFSERRFSSMDYDFWLRALAATRRIVRVPEVLAFYRWHDSGQISSVKWRQVLDALAAQQDFIRNNPGLVKHLGPARLRELTEGKVLQQAYRAIWKRDLVSAQRLFRHAAGAGAFGMKDIPHIVAAMLPMPLYRRAASLADRGKK